MRYYARTVLLRMKTLSITIRPDSRMNLRQFVSLTWIAAADKPHQPA